MHKRSLLRIMMLGIFLIGTSVAGATNYYFSTSTGDDSHSSSQAQNPDTPWKSIGKLNESMHIFQPGDSILFKRGEVFLGQINLNSSGAQGANLTLGAYGSGTYPVIQGNVTIGPWTQSNGNVWSADYTSESSVHNFLVNGNAQPLGRYPNPDATNRGYLRIDSHEGRTSVTSSSLSSGNWTGGEAVIRSVRWVLDRLPIQSHQGSTLQLSEGTSFGMTNGYGFFIQSHLSTLDQAGEWYFDQPAGKFYMYWNGNPNEQSTTATAFDNTLHATHEEYVTIQDLEFRGSQQENVFIDNCSNLKIQRNNICESGLDAVYISSSHTIEFSHNTIRNSNNNAFILADSRDVFVSHNEILNTGLRAGMGLNYTAVPMSYELVNCYFEYNVIDSTGYNGIFFGGDSIFIRNNFISNFCMTVDDGAAIYTSGESSRLYFNRFIENNIVLNGLGAGEGTTDPGYSAADGIYMDDRTSYVNITGNTVAGTGRGFYLHNAHHINLNGNTSYNNDKQLLLNHDENYPEFPITNCVIDGNIFFSKFRHQYVADYKTADNGITNFGNIDNNYYCRPIDDDATIHTRYITGDGEIMGFMSLGSWQSTFNHDLNSSTSPFNVPSFQVTSATGNNKYNNGSFNSDVSEWYCWANYDNCGMEWDEKQGMDGGSMKLGFSGSSGQKDGYLLAMGNIGEVVSGTSYVMKFSIIAATGGKTIKIVLRRDGSSSEDLAPAQFITLKPDRQEYELLFTANSYESSARIDFVISEEAGTLWIDNLEVFPAQVKKTDMNQNMKLLFNPNNWVMDFQTTNGEFYDVEGNLYTNFTLQPYTSLLLINPNPDQGNVIQSVHETSRGEIMVYPNPVAKVLHIRTPGPGLKIFGIYDLSGALMVELQQEGTENAIGVNDLNPGIYILRIKEEGNISSLRFCKY